MKTITTINEARTIANIAERASSLFATGYTLKALNASAGLYVVSAPANARRADANGCPLPPYIVDTAAQTCSCKAFGRWNTCKHLLAVEEEEGRTAWAEAQYERSGRADWEAFGKYL